MSLAALMKVVLTFDNPGHLANNMKTIGASDKEISYIIEHAPDWSNRPGPSIFGKRAWEDTYGPTGDFDQKSIDILSKYYL